MSDAQILDEGDLPPHEHLQSLPDVPSRRVRYANGYSPVVDLENAIARCACGRLFVSRLRSDSLSTARWVPLRWWHRTAQRKLRDLGE